MALEQLTMPAGLTVYVDHIPAAQTAQIEAMVDVGSVHEAPHEVGLAHALEHVTHLQTPQFPTKADLTRFCGLHAMQANAATSYLRTRYYAQGPDLEPMIHQMSEVVCRPIFEPGPTAREMDVIAEECRRRLTNIPVLHRFAIGNVLFGEPYGRDPVGHGDNIRYTDEQVQAFYDKYYGYGNMAFLAVGKATLEETVQLVERHFTPMGEAAKPVAPPIERLLTENIRSGYITNSSNVHLSKAVALSPELREAVLADLPIFRAALGALSTRLMHVLREDMGVAYDARTIINWYNHPKAWHLSTNTSVAPANIGKTEDGLVAALSCAPERYTDDEVGAAIGQIRGWVLSDMDTLEGRMDAYDFTRHHFGTPGSLEDEARAVRALTLDDVRAAMGQLLGHLAENVSVTHLTGGSEAIGKVDHMVQRTDIA